MSQSENRAAWVTALRSQKYKQGYGHLREIDLHCCLGVACELQNVPFADGGYIFGINAVMDMEIPEKKFYEWFGLPLSAQLYLADMNDIECKTFPEIAEYLEQHLFSSYPL